MPLGRISKHKMAKRGEERTARDVGGRRQPGSGSTPWAKGDVRNKDLLVERKDTTKVSYVLKWDDLLKLRSEAVLADKTPVFAVCFGAGDDAYAVMPWSVFLELYGERE